jgi:hypothetical protein
MIRFGSAKCYATHFKYIFLFHFGPEGNRIGRQEKRNRTADNEGLILKNASKKL